MPQSKTPICTSNYTQWSPTVISMALAPWTTSFRTYYTLAWICTVSMMNKVYRKLTNEQNGLDSFTMSNQSQIDRYFRAYLLTSFAWFPLYFNVQTMQEQQLHLKKKHLVMRSNIKITPNIKINGLGTLHTAFTA